MRKIRNVAAVVIIVAAASAVLVTRAQQLGTTRTEVVRSDLSVPGREVIQVMVEFQPGVVAARHSHPGEEIAYVVTGVLEYRLDGRPAATVRAGQSLFIPAGAVHEVRNVGSGNAAELATYIVEKGKPLLVVAK